MKYLLLFGLIAMLISLNGNLAFSEDLIISATPRNSTFQVGVYPSIGGIVTDGQGAPLSNVYVYALYPSKTVEAMTNSNGKFTLNPLTAYPVGEYSIDVYARSETILSRTTVNFAIVETTNQDESEWLSNSTNHATNDQSNFRGLSSNQTYSHLDLVTRQLMLENPQNIPESEDIQEESGDIVNNPRKQSQKNLELALSENSRDLQKKENRGAFANFVAKLDSLMHAIFWDQFEFTQKISDDAYQAKQDALEDGKTSLEATKVYQEEAAVSKSELTQYIKELNIKHGFTNSTTQEPFDKNGKLPRTGDN